MKDERVERWKRKWMKNSFQLIFTNFFLIEWKDEKIKIINFQVKKMTVRSQKLEVSKPKRNGNQKVISKSEYGKLKEKSDEN